MSLKLHFSVALDTDDRHFTFTVSPYSTSTWCELKESGHSCSAPASKKKKAQKIKEICYILKPVGFLFPFFSYQLSV